VEIEIQVYGRHDARLEESRLFEVQSYGNLSIFTFNAYENYNSEDYRYDIYLYVSTALIGSFDVHLATGDIMFQSDHNGQIGELSLEATTGMVYANIEETIFLEKSSPIILKTITGAVDVQLINNYMPDLSNWILDCVTGDIRLRHDQITPLNSTMNIELETTTGGITYEFTYNETNSMGLHFDVNILTGQFTTTGFSEAVNLPYSSTNFDSAQFKVISSLTVTTGNIAVVKN
jgi:hypothetical protein